MNRDAETVPARHETPDVTELRDQIAGTIHRRICEHSREDCIENLGKCERATDSAMPLISTALDEGHAMARLLADALNDAIRTIRELAEKAAGEPIPFGDSDLYAEVVDGALDDADALRAELAHMTEARNNARAERDALRTWQERVAVAAGIGDEVEGRGVYLEANPDAAAEHVAGLLAVADTHIECPVYCGGCGEPLADALCDHCSGSGCGPGTALGAYEECGWCAGAGKVHPGCADLSYADLVAERDALAAKVERVRALHRAVGIFDECDCDAPDPATHLDVDYVGLTCNLMYRVCAECCRDDVYQTEDCASYHAHRLDEDYHCPTIRALDEEPQP